MTRVAVNIDRSRFQPHVGCFYREGLRIPELLAADVPVVEFPFRGWKSPGSFYRMASSFLSYVRRHRIRLIHTYDCPAGMFLIPLARLARVPVVISSQLSLRELNSPQEQRLLRLTDLSSDRIVVNSGAVLEDMATRYGIQRPKLSLIYNGVDTRLFKPGEKRLIEGAQIVIGSIAALRAEKQLHLLIEAFAQVRRERPGVKLLIVGSGVEEPRLRNRAAELGVMNDIVWVPAQSDVTGWMRAIDIFVLPSRSESFPNGLLEAMASGCCPVGSNVGGVPELIEDGKSGLLFASGDVSELSSRLRTLLHDDEFRIRLAHAAVERAHTRFTLERFVTNTSDLYSSLLAQYSGSFVSAN